jgi:hypothetical protein
LTYVDCARRRVDEQTYGTVGKSLQMKRSLRRARQNWLDNITLEVILKDRLCGLMVRVRGYRSGGPGSIPGTTRKKK